jgi:hypothetical protein
VTATGVLVITPESAGRWVGPHPAAVILLRTMREVRNLDTIKVANRSAIHPSIPRGAVCGVAIRPRPRHRRRQSRSARHFCGSYRGGCDYLQ